MPAEAHGAQRALEVALWAAPAGLATLRLLRDRPGERAGWWVLAIGCATIALDKAVDLMAVVMPWLRELAWSLDPEASSKGSKPWVRLGLVVGAAGLLALGLVLVARRDRRLDGPKRLGLLGLLLVVAYLGARQVLGRDRIPGSVAWAWEGAAWALVALGCLAGPRRASEDPASPTSRHTRPRT